MASTLTKTLLTKNNLVLFICSSFVFLVFIYLSTKTPHTPKLIEDDIFTNPFNCYGSPQSHPIFANVAEGLDVPIMYSISDFSPENPNRNILQMLEGKPFEIPSIASAIQKLLEKATERRGMFVDVGAGVGVSSFVAAAMGFPVAAFECSLENVKRICDGIYLNRLQGKIQIFHGFPSDHHGNVTFHGFPYESGITQTTEEGNVESEHKKSETFRSIVLDEVIKSNDPVILIKIDVKGHEYHAIKSSTKLLSRNKNIAPYLIYREDHNSLMATNTSSMEILQFLDSLGYRHCAKHDEYVHCTK